MNYSTEKELQESNETVSFMNLKDYKSILYLVYYGSDKLEYYFFHNDELLFYGSDYKPSPLHSIDGIESMVGLLAFITLQIGDVGREYFKNYNNDQFEWIDSEYCDRLKTLISDFEHEEKDSPEYHTEAKMYFDFNYNNK